MQSYAVDYNDTYPAAGTDLQATLDPNYVDNWPKDPWSAGVKMSTNSATKGNAMYSIPGSNTFQLIGYGKNNNGVITVP